MPSIKLSLALLATPFLTTVTLSTKGELTLNTLLTATEPLFFLTVKVFPIEPPFIATT